MASELRKLECIVHPRFKMHNVLICPSGFCSYFISLCFGSKTSSMIHVFANCSCVYFYINDVLITLNTYYVFLRHFRHSVCLLLTLLSLFPCFCVCFSTYFPSAKEQRSSLQSLNHVSKTLISDVCCYFHAF